MATRDTLKFRKGETVKIKVDCRAKGVGTSDTPQIKLAQGRKGTYRGDGPSGHPLFALVDLEGTREEAGGELEVNYDHLERA